LETLNELQMGTIPTRKLHMMQGLRIRINDVDHLFFGPVVHDPDSKFNVQEIEDVGLVPMASVTDLLARNEGEKFNEGDKVLRRSAVILPAHLLHLHHRR
jgi:hypothetical protein